MYSVVYLHKDFNKFRLLTRGCFIEAYVSIGIVNQAHESEPLNNLSIFLLLLPLKNHEFFQSKSIINFEVSLV